MIRILIADDHEIVRHGLSLALSQEKDFTVVGLAQNGREALEKINKTIPDILIVDWKMPRLDGLETAVAVREAKLHTKILLLTGAPIETAVLDAVEHGIDGFVTKDISPARLAHAIRRLASGEKYLDSTIRDALYEHNTKKQNTPPQPKITLSNREQEVLELMATSMTYKEIAKQLIIGEETVRTYAKRILAKLNQPNRTQAVITALRLKLISL